MLTTAGRRCGKEPNDARVVYGPRQLGEDEEAAEPEVDGPPGSLPVREELVERAEREPVDALRGVPRASWLCKRVQDAL